MLPKIGVLNISDRASAGVYEDIPGQACLALLREWLAGSFETDYRVVPDEQAVIEAEMRRMADTAGCCLVITTGGTGPAPRDVTPEATAAVCAKILPGFGELMRAASLRHVPTAILSRQVAGIRGKTLIVNLPGRPKAIRENLEAVFPAIPYCLDLIGGPHLETTPAMKVSSPPRCWRASGWTVIVHRSRRNAPMPEYSATQKPSPSTPSSARNRYPRSHAGSCAT